MTEDLSLTGSNITLFAFRFTDPGVYAFQLSSDADKKFYVTGNKET